MQGFLIYSIHGLPNTYSSEKLFIVYIEQNLNLLPLDGAAWKWDKMAAVLFCFVFFNLSRKQSSLAKFHVINKTKMGTVPIIKAKMVPWSSLIFDDILLLECLLLVFLLLSLAFSVLAVLGLSADPTTS